MIASFQETCSSAFTELIVNTDKASITSIFNEEFKSRPDYDFYFMANDDIIFETVDWDVKLARKGKITHGTDAVAEGVNGQFLMIDGDIARAIGWIQLPTLNRYCGDVTWRFIAKNLNILKYVPEVIIEHKWHESQVDQKVHIADQIEFAKWLPYSFKDTNKIRRALNETKHIC
jgi:hypothetical protein